MKNTHYSSVPDRDLVPAWLSFVARPGCSKALDRFGRAIDTSLRACRPSDSFGSLRDRSNEIWQDARILLLHGGTFHGRRRGTQPCWGGYLAGNLMLSEATIRGDVAEIGRQLIRSQLAALNHCYKRMRRLVVIRVALHRSLDEVLEHNLGSSVHPSAKKLETLPSPVLKEFVLALLTRAVTRGDLSKKTMAIAIRILVDGICQSDIAREHGVSRQAIHQRLNNVRRCLERQIPCLEVPLS